MTRLSAALLAATASLPIVIAKLGEVYAALQALPKLEQVAVKEEPAVK